MCREVSDLTPFSPRFVDSHPHVLLQSLRENAYRYLAAGTSMDDSLIEFERTLQQLEEKVERYLKVSGNCAQTSFLALQEQFGLDNGSILKALTGFPGIALRGETCGAVVGCLMALGLVYGRERLDDWEGYRRALRHGRKFCRSFEKEFGSTMCGDVVESVFGKRYNLANPVEAEEWQKADAEEKCSRVIAAAVRIAAKIIIARD